MENDRLIQFLDARVERILERQRAGLPAQATAMMFFSKIGHQSGLASRFALELLDAVSDKYAADGCAQIPKILDLARALWKAMPVTASVYGLRIEVARLLQAFQPRTKRLHIHAGRRHTDDRDLRLCESLLFCRHDYIYFALAPWVCQQDDLRYRFTDTSIIRLRWLNAWWRNALSGDTCPERLPPFPISSGRVMCETNAVQPDTKFELRR